MAARRVVLGDGAKWIWNLADQHFPDAIQIVDRFHAKQHLSDVGKAIYGATSDLAREWARERHEQLDAGQLDALLVALRTHAPANEEARNCIKYIENNRHRMRYLLRMVKERYKDDSLDITDAGEKVSLAEWRDLNATRVLREYKNGEGFLYLGRAYRLLLVSDQLEPLQLRNGRFALRRDIVEQGEMEAAKAAFRDYYTARGLERIRQRVDYYAPKVGVSSTTVNVRDLGNRWASCSPTGALAFHWKCMMAPQTIIDYIVVHELCHFHHRDHTDAFWNEVDKVMPDHGERKEWLRKNGAGLDV